MAHSHAHSHGEGEGTYFLDQLFTILASGALGVVAILMYQTGILGRILAPMFFKPVLIGGVAILLLAIIRAIAVWQLAGARRQAEAEAVNHNHEHGHSHSHSVGHEHAHSHGDDCGHDHGHTGACDHDHSHSHAEKQEHAATDDDHGHDHSWAPWRYIVVAIPIFLYFLGLPREGFSDPDDHINKGSLTNPNRRAMSLLAGGPAMTKVLRKGEPQELRLGFKELSEAAAMPARHDAYEGDIGIIRGEFVPMPGTDHEFTLVRWNMTCCRADAIALETRIVAPDPVRIDGRPWVKVSGVISFEKTDRGKWIPVLTLRSNADIEETESTQDANAP